MTTGTNTPWISCYQPRPNARIRLFCFPYAGAGATAYRPWQAMLPDWIEVCPVEPPGRWSRLREPPFTECTPLVAAAYDGLRPLFDMPFAFFGYSLGALIAFELTRHLRRKTEPGPVHIFAAARRAPQLVPPTRHEQVLHRLADDALVEQLKRYYSGMIEPVSAQPDLLEIVLPTTRADIAVLETYTYEREPPLDCPITGFRGEHDDANTREDLEVWQDQTNKEFALHTLPGGHFFIKDELPKTIATIEAALKASAP